VAIVVMGRASLPSIGVFGSQYFIQITQLSGQVVQLSDNCEGNPSRYQPLKKASPGKGSHRQQRDQRRAGCGFWSRPIVLGGRLAGTVQVAQSQGATDDALLATRRVLLDRRASHCCCLRRSAVRSWRAQPCVLSRRSRAQPANHSGARPEPAHPVTVRTMS